MKCPYCSVHFSPNTESINVRVADKSDKDGRSCDIAYTVEYGLCPECENFYVVYMSGRLDCDEWGDNKHIIDPKTEIIFPKLVSRPVPLEVPKKYSDDFKEAAAIISLSPKASAALSRRLLQTILHEHYKIEKRTLNDEIDEFLKLRGLPTQLSSAVDAIRNIGNFGAHPIKSTNTGEIVEVEPGEVEWLIDVMEFLFDYTFVQPKKLDERKLALNKKLTDLGKPLLK